MAMTHEEKKRRRREWYANLPPEKKQAHKDYMRDWRAKQSEEYNENRKVSRREKYANLPEHEKEVERAKFRNKYYKRVGNMSEAEKAEFRSRNTELRKQWGADNPQKLEEYKEKERTKMKEQPFLKERKNMIEGMRYHYRKGDGLQYWNMKQSAWLAGKNWREAKLAEVKASGSTMEFRFASDDLEMWNKRYDWLILWEEKVKDQAGLEA